MGYNGKIPNEVMSLVFGAATDGRMWSQFCDTLSHHIGTPVMMFAHDIGSDESLGIMGGGLDPEQLQIYHDYYADKNPWMEMNVKMPVGMVGISDQALEQSQLFKTEFYNDWLKLQDNIVGGPATICHREGNSFAALALACRSRLYDDMVADNFDFLSELGGYVTKSILMSKVFLNGDATSRLRFANLRQAIIFIHQSGRAGYWNNAADRILTNSNLMKLSHRQRITSGSDELRGFIDNAVLAMQRQAFMELPLPRPFTTTEFGACVFHAHIFPESVEINFPEAVWADPVVGALVICSSDGLEAQPAYGKLIEGFGATPAETTLAEALLSGMSLYDYASLNKLSRHTVRNQMRALLTKTQTRNQTEFVHNMLQLASPFSTTFNTNGNIADF